VVGEGVEESAAGAGHALAAEAVDLDAGVSGLECADEVGPVKVAAGFAGANEETHRWHPAFLERYPIGPGGRSHE
jgi:hypothetical protein